MTNETIWVWLQAKGKILKVISDPERGTIEVRNEEGETLIRKTDLSRRQVELIETNFLNAIAKKLNGKNEATFRKLKDSFDPMVA